MITQEFISCHEQLEEIRKIWQVIFPKETLYKGFEGKDCFEYSLNENNIGNHRYYIYRNGFTPVGMSGMYDEPNETPKESAWLGWFGVLETMRRRGYGSKIIGMFEEEAKRLGYKYCRVYTEDAPDNKAIKFYENLGYTFEKYDGPVPKDCNVDGILVGSKAIADKELTKWNNREIYFE